MREQTRDFLVVVPVRWHNTMPSSAAPVRRRYNSHESTQVPAGTAAVASLIIVAPQKSLLRPVLRPFGFRLEDLVLPPRLREMRVLTSSQFSAVGFLIADDCLQLRSSSSLPLLLLLSETSIELLLLASSSSSDEQSSKLNPDKNSVSTVDAL
mmetsp:Transcript_20151/g.49422  ORF Transcript_20151/g.49422 Transcript_20151/m.49422 type:complete len:153 (+) Transcript_20151:249-707(+)